MTVIKLQKRFVVRPVHDMLLVDIYHLHMATAEQLRRLHGYAERSLNLVKLRLKTLEDQGFIQHDRCPTKQGNAPFHYCMSAKGMRYLASLGYDHNESLRAEKEIHTNAAFMRHTLEVNDVLISAALLGKHTPHFYLSRFVHERTLHGKPCLLTWQGKSRKLIPDALLDFRMVLEGGSERRRVVLLEHDRGTEYERAFRKCIRSYIVMLRAGAHQQHFGAKSVAIAFTTFEGDKRLAQMRKWTLEELKVTQELANVGLHFFFSAQPKPPAPQCWLEACWQTPYEGERCSLLGGG